MRKKLVIFVGILTILLSLAGCSSTELNVKEENVMVEYDEDIYETTEESLSNDKELLSKADTEETSQDNKVDFESVYSEKDVITTEVNDVKTEGEGTVSEKPVENTATKPSTNTGTTNNNSGNNSSDSGGNQSDNTTQETPTPQTSKEAFDLINAERIKLGLEPAVWDAECERIALIRGEEIAPYAIPEHDGFLKFQNENRKLCECLAWGYLTAEGAVDAWMNSSAHKDILMDSDYVKLAIVRIGNKWVAVNSR